MEGIKSFLERMVDDPDLIQVYRDDAQCLVFYQNRLMKLRPTAKVSEDLVRTGLASAECDICRYTNHGFHLCNACYGCVCKNCYTHIRYRCPYCRRPYQ